MLRVKEIFHSIQGEGRFTGTPTVFVRLSHCNLRCTWCDTDFLGGQRMTVNEVARKVEEFGCPRVCVTGGEPLLQRETPLLFLRLLADGYLVSVETSGSVPLQAVPHQVHVVMDLKTPASGEADRNLFDEVRYADELKLVIKDAADFAWAVETLERLEPKVDIILSPVHGVMTPLELSTLLLGSSLARWPNVRLGLQLHKYIGVE